MPADAHSDDLDSSVSVELFIPCEQIRADPSGAAEMRRILGCATSKWFPLDLPFAAYVELWGPAFLSFSVSIRVTDSEGTEIASQGPEHLRIDADGIITAGVVFPDGLSIPYPGVYHAQLLHDDRPIAERRFRVETFWSRDTVTQ